MKNSINPLPSMIIPETVTPACHRVYNTPTSLYFWGLPVQWVCFECLPLTGQCSNLVMQRMKPTEPHYDCTHMIRTFSAKKAIPTITLDPKNV